MRKILFLFALLFLFIVSCTTTKNLTEIKEVRIQYAEDKMTYVVEVYNGEVSTIATELKTEDCNYEVYEYGEYGKRGNKLSSIQLVPHETKTVLFVVDCFKPIKLEWADIMGYVFDEVKIDIIAVRK